MAKDSHRIPLTFEQALKQIVPSEAHETFTNLVVGDCRCKLREIEQESIHFVVTDPPYFLDGLDGNWKKGKPKKTTTGTVGGLPVGMKFEREQGLKLEAFMLEVSSRLLEVLKPGGFVLCFSQPRLSHRMATGLENVGFEIRDMYAWHFTQRAQAKAFKMDHFINRMDIPSVEKRKLKRQLRGRKTPQLRPQFEIIIMAQKPKDGTFVDNYLKHGVGLVDVSASLDGKTASTVMQVEKPAKKQYNEHLTVKPVKLIEHLIKLFSEPGQIVLDPFIGSGTTAIAAANTGRACIGIDIDPHYIEIAEERLRTEPENERD